MTKSIRIDEDVANRVLAHVKKAKPKITIAYFLSSEIGKVMDKIEKKKKVS